MTRPSEGNVVRLSRVPGGWRDRFRSYSVILDGKRVALIKRGERLDLPVTPGRHTIWLSIDWARSPELELDMAPEEIVDLECAPTEVPPFGLGSGAYIMLRRTNPVAS